MEILVPLGMTAVFLAVVVFFSVRGLNRRWSKAAKRLGLEYSSGGIEDGFHLTGVYRGVEVRVASRTRTELHASYDFTTYEVKPRVALPEGASLDADIVEAVRQCADIEAALDELGRQMPDMRLEAGRVIAETPGDATAFEMELTLDILLATLQMLDVGQGRTPVDDAGQPSLHDAIDASSSSERSRAENSANADNAATDTETPW